MKYIFAFVSLFMANIVLAQSEFPDFLQGNWKMENKEEYEHWDKLNENTLKGFSYKLEAGQMTISEYLDISETNKQITYTATVLNQNQGKEINFKLKRSDSLYTFENSNHDFPKMIEYQKMNDHEIKVRVSDGNQKEFSYKMQKQISKSIQQDTSVLNPNYNPLLAQKLGADDYGMKSYVLVILKTGPTQTTDKALISNSFRGHMDNINHLVKKGKMIVAGPLGTNDNTYRGIFILNVATTEEAEKLLQNDLAIKNGLLDFEIFNWYGSAALPEYLPIADEIWKLNP